MSRLKPHAVSVLLILILMSQVDDGRFNPWLYLAVPAGYLVVAAVAARLRKNKADG